MKQRTAKKNGLSRIDYFFTNQSRFFRAYIDHPKFTFNLIFHLTVSVLSILIIYQDKIRNFIGNYKNIESILNINISLAFRLSFSVIDIFIFSILFFALIKMLKSTKKFKQVFSVVCASYYFMSFQKLLNLMYQIIEKENTIYKTPMNVVVDSIFKYFNIFSIFFIIFIMIGLYVITEIDINKIFVGTVIASLFNLAFVVIVAIFTLKKDDLMLVKRTLLNLFSKQG
ncbi:MAG: YIP1 family protein [Oscillospiraceae bacterium]|nr:YIP1 family protein [Oscillospiraceae bacterium]